MIAKLLIAWALVAVTVAVHAGGLVALLRRLTPATAAPPARFWPMAWLLVRVTWILIMIHLVEIAIWGFFFVGVGSLPNLESALYFSATTYATVGYGDVVLKDDWRMFGPVEGLVGILMCGLSTGLFFAVLNKLISAQTSPMATVGAGSDRGHD